MLFGGLQISLIGGFLGGLGALIPLWQHGNEWESRTRQVIGWLVLVLVILATCIEAVKLFL